MANQVTVGKITVGDHVRLKSFVANHHESYETENAQFAFRHEPVDGLILSIRDIATGQLVTSTDGQSENYIIEMIFDNTFSTRFASLRNAPRGVDRPAATPAWKRMRAALQESAAKGEVISTGTADFLATSPLAKLLDGWKVLKVHSDALTTLDAPAENAAQA